MDETPLAQPRFPTLERPAVAHSFKALAALLALAIALTSAGVLPPLGAGLLALAVLGMLAALLLGWRWFREGLAAVQSTILLAAIYLIGIGVVAIVARIARRDLLDLRQPKASLWRRRDLVKPEELVRTIEHPF